MILICRAWYNKSNELGISDTIHQFNTHDNLSARYLNRIGENTCCSIDRKVSCLSAPDRIEMNQLSPTVVTRLVKLTMGLPPVVSLGKSSSVSGKKRKRECYSVGVDPVSGDKKVVMKKRKCLPECVLVYCGKHDPLQDRRFLLPYDLPHTEYGMAKFARIPPNNILSLLETMEEKCPSEIYNRLLDRFKSEHVFLFVRSIGESGLTLLENDRLAGKVMADSSSHHDKSDGKVICQWAPILDNESDREHSIAEIEKLINIDVLLYMLERTYGTDVAKRSSVTSFGSNQYADKSCVVSQQIILPHPRSYNPY